MDKSFKILLSIALTALLISIVLNLKTNRNLKKVTEKLEQSEKNLNSAMKNINFSKSKIDSIHSDLVKFKFYVKDIQGRVEMIDIKRRIKETIYPARQDSLKKRLKELTKEVNTTGEEFPEIPVTPL